MATSYTQVSLYEKCPFAYHCRYKQRLVEPSSPALERGIKTHEICDRYLKGDRKTLPKEIHPAARRYISKLKEMPGSSEEFWHFDRNWNLVDDWNWLVIKMDHYAMVSDRAIRLTDFKTGKMYPTHKDQLSLYAVGGFSAYDCDIVEAVALYLDTGQSLVYKWKDSQYDTLADSWEYRIEQLEKETKFEMKPGYHCKWCAWRKSRGGPCSYA